MSTSQRIEDIKWVFSNLGLSFIFGNGVGALMNSRLYIETIYLQFLWQFGIFSLIFWSYPVLTIFNIRKKIDSLFKYNLSSTMLLLCLLIYIQSIFNPYLNPIGLPIVLLSLFHHFKIYNHYRQIRYWKKFLYVWPYTTVCPI